MDPDTNVAELSMDEAAQSALRHAIDAMFMEGRVHELFDDFHLRTMMYSAATRGLEDEDQSSSDGVDAA